MVGIFFDTAAPYSPDLGSNPLPCADDLPRKATNAANQTGRHCSTANGPCKGAVGKSEDGKGKAEGGRASREPSGYPLFALEIERELGAIGLAR